MDWLASNVDRRVILAVSVQESSGDVHFPTTTAPGDPDQQNPGLMQSNTGASFDPNNPKGNILQMVRDGTEGTKSGDGLTQLLRQYGNIYEALRGYNSRSVHKNNLNNAIGATISYVSDVANRLMGAIPKSKNFYLVDLHHHHHTLVVDDQSNGLQVQ